MSDDLAHVLDVVLAGRSIRQFMSGVTEERFLSDIEKQSAVLYQFTILGEAARRVSEPFRSAHSEVDWKGIVSFRNRIIHNYDEVNLDRVWEIVQGDLPLMLTSLEPLVPKEPDGR